MLFKNDEIKSLFVTPQRRELIMCVSDLIMDFECPHATIKKLIKLIYKESVKLKRHDVIENLNLHNLID